MAGNPLRGAARQLAEQRLEALRAAKMRAGAREARRQADKALGAAPAAKMQAEAREARHQAVRGLAEVEGLPSLNLAKQLAHSLLTVSSFLLWQPRPSSTE